MPASAAAPATPAVAAPRLLDGLRVIALLRFGKLLLVLATAYGVYRLLDPDVVARIYGWTETLSDGYERRLVRQGLNWLGGVSTGKVVVTLAVTAAYSLLLVIEGTGLWLRRAWAEWITVVSTSLLVPFELWDLFTRPAGRRLAVFGAFVINVAIIVYLVLQLRSNRRRIRHGRPDA